MKVITYLSGNPVHDRVLKAFHNGIPVHSGLTAEMRDVHKYVPSDIAVVFGIRKSKIPLSWPRGEIIQRMRAAKRPVVILETGYVKRGDGANDYYAAGLNGLNGRADFRNKDMALDRWQQLGVTIGPYRANHLSNYSAMPAHILVIGQVPWDASVDHHDHLGWIRSTIAKINAISGKPIIFRPHPLAQGVNYGLLKGAVISANTLADDLHYCHAVVTFNSNTGVDALLDGIPVFSDDEGSMVRAVSNHDLKDIDHPTEFDRTQWAADLAYTQWTVPEIERGWTWRHLFRPNKIIQI